MHRNGARLRNLLSRLTFVSDTGLPQPRARPCTTTGMSTLAVLAAAAAASLLPVSPSRPARVVSSETALSVFREPAPDRCTWLRVDPVQGRRELITEFPLGCEGLSASWSPDGARAIVEFPGEWEPGTGRTRHAWIVDLTVRPAAIEGLPLPTAGMLDVLAFDTDGAPLALFIDSPADPAKMDARVITFEGTRYDIQAVDPGVPALAHAFRHERGAWTRIETVATSSEACGSLGVRRLRGASRIARSTTRFLDPAEGHELSTDPIDSELFERLESHERIDAESVYAWVRLATERSAVLAVEGGFEYSFLTTPVLLVDDDGVHELDGMAENAILAASSRGRYLLLSEAVSGARPLLYDLEGARLLFSASDAVAVTFWP